MLFSAGFEKTRLGSKLDNKRSKTACYFTSRCELARRMKDHSLQRHVARTDSFRSSFRTRSLSFLLLAASLDLLFGTGFFKVLWL